MKPTRSVAGGDDPVCDVDGDEGGVEADGAPAPPSHAARTAMMTQTPQESPTRRTVRCALGITSDEPSYDG